MNTQAEHTYDEVPEDMYSRFEREYRNRRSHHKANGQAIWRLETAISFFMMGSIPERSKNIAEQIEFEMGVVKRSVRHAQARLEQMKADFFEEGEALSLYRERFVQLQSARAEEVAATFVDDHRAACREIARCIEALHSALQVEARIHDAFAAVSPADFKQSYLLPQHSGALKHAISLDQRDSIAAQWSRDARKAGLI